MRFLTNVKTQIYDRRIRRMSKFSWILCKHLSCLIFLNFFLPYYLVGGIICYSLVMSDVGCHAGMFLYAGMIAAGTLRASPAAVPACPGPQGSPSPAQGHQPCPRNAAAGGVSSCPHPDPAPWDSQWSQLPGHALTIFCPVLVTNINTGACKKYLWQLVCST